MRAKVYERLADNLKRVYDWEFAISAGQLKHMLTEGDGSFHSI